MCYHIPFMVGFLSFVLHFVHVMHLISCHHVHLICIRVRLMHPRIFPVVRFAIRHSHMHRRTPLASSRVRVLNVLGMNRALPSVPGIAPVDHLSSFGSFGARLVLQRLTALSQRPLLSCSPTPLQNSPITHLTPLHALGRSITIVWAKTTPHLDTPSSLYLYI